MKSAVRHVILWVWRWVRRPVRFFFPWKDYVIHQGMRLPRPSSRLNMEDQKDNDFFIASAVLEAQRVIGRLDCRPGSFLVDIGCGQGRLAIGLAGTKAHVAYLGLDVSQTSIAWCTEHIEKLYPAYRFQHVNLVNARYNPEGVPLSPDFRLPVADSAADAVYLWGVVTNMEPEHLATYVAEISRILKPSGKVFLTANVESDVPESSINPENYTTFACVGPLNIVRYEREYFLSVFHRAGLTLTGLDYHAAGNCQSELYFEKQAGAHVPQREDSASWSDDSAART